MVCQRPHGPPLSSRRNTIVAMFSDAINPIASQNGQNSVEVLAVLGAIGLSYRMAFKMAVYVMCNRGVTADLPIRRCVMPFCQLASATFYATWSDVLIAVDIHMRQA